MTLLKRRAPVFIAACAGMATFGFSLALLGTLFGFPEMRARLHADLLHEGELSTLLIAGLWLSTVFAGPIIDRFGSRLVLSVSSLLVGAAYLSFVQVSTFSQAAAAGVLLGFGGGGLNTSANTVVSELYHEKRGAMLNLLAIFLGLGAVVVPLLAARISLQVAIFSAASFALLCGLVCWTLPFPPAKERESFALREAGKVVTYPGVLLFSFLLFFESANEQVMNTFTSTWVGAAGATARAATLVLAGYQICMALGRILAAVLLRVVSKPQLVLACALGSISGTAILCWRHDVPGIAVGVLVTGSSLSAIFPTMLAIAGDRYRRFAGTVFGTMFAISLVGAGIAPSTVGVIGKNFGVHFGTLVPLSGAVMVTLLAFAVVGGRHGLSQARDAKSAP
jgi:MFS transporter, FHS family, glucose/mannose:H+ symporter